MAPEVKAKISFALKGRMPAVNAMGLAPWNKGVKGGQVSWNKGKPLSPEHRANLSKSKKGRTVSAEHREKLSVASRKRWGLPAKAA